MTLVIMAAGMGSRFGGLKQIEPVGPNGEFIIDYSIYDAIKAGFDKVVFIIKEENYELFKSTIGNRIENRIKVEYVFQDSKNIPKWVDIPTDRVKPFGTAQALYCCKDVVKGDFAVISADDFYGSTPFKLLIENFKNKYEFSCIGYQIGNCISDKGSVKRGVCFDDENGYLKKIIESKVQKINDRIIGVPLDNDEEYEITNEHPVSMLMFGMNSIIFDYIEKDIDSFFKNNIDNMNTCEYLLPSVLSDMMKKGIIKIKLVPTKAVWKGVTYKEDLDNLKEYIQELIDSGYYPNKLY